MPDPDYFTLDEFRTLPDVPPSEYSDAKVLAAAAHFTTIVERETDHAFIPRTITDVLDGTGTSNLILTRNNVRSLTSCTVDGVTVDVALLTTRHGVLRYKTNSGGWRKTFPCGAGNVTVVYSAGDATCPADIKDAVMWATRDRLISQNETSGSWDRKSSVSNAVGDTIQYVLPGEKRPTGYPELDALIASYVRNTASFGFA